MGLAKLSCLTFLLALRVIFSSLEGSLNLKTCKCLWLRNGIYQCSLTDAKPALELIQLESSVFIKQLSGLEESFPLKDLYKIVDFGNVDDYMGRKERRLENFVDPI